jgi:hypothetical protein
MNELHQNRVRATIARRMTGCAAERRIECRSSANHKFDGVRESERLFEKYVRAPIGCARSKERPRSDFDFQPILNWRELDRNGQASTGRIGRGPI